MFASHFGSSMAEPSDGPTDSPGRNGHPQTTDPLEKYFERQGFDIREIAAADIPNHSNSVEDVAFCITDDSEPINDEIKASHRIAVFARESDAIELSLGDRFDGGARLTRLEDQAEGSEFRGFGVDATRDGAGVRLLTTTRGCRMRDVTVRGELDSVGQNNESAVGGVYAHVPRGEKVTLEDVNLPDGASRTWPVPSYNDSIGVILIGSSNGVLEMDHCTIGGFPNNGCYTSGCRKHGNDGYAKITNHIGYNSDRDQVRLGNQGYVRDSALFADKQKPGFNALRGVWSRYARGVRIENCEIKTHFSDYGSAVRVDSTAGETTVTDCDIELRSSNYASRGVLAYSPSSEAGKNRAVHIEDSRIYGDGNARDGILILPGRPDSTIENVDFDLPNAAELIDNRSCESGDTPIAPHLPTELSSKI